jgi:hypothetical protein
VCGGSGSLPARALGHAEGGCHWLRDDGRCAGAEARRDQRRELLVITDGCRGSGIRVSMAENQTIMFRFWRVVRHGRVVLQVWP